MIESTTGVSMVTVTLLPSKKQVRIPAGAKLHEVLAAHGAEAPCGGTGTCRGCRVRVVSGLAPITDRQREVLLPRELDAGWRLACQCTPTDDMEVYLPSSNAVVLADDVADHFVPEDGYGVAADIGTTTLAVQLVHLKTGKVLGLRTALNPQAAMGSDVMSRIEAAVRGCEEVLKRTIQECIGGMISNLMREFHVPAPELKRVYLVGNTVMHHLFCGFTVEPLSHVPFETPYGDSCKLHAASLCSDLCETTQVLFLPCLGGFVGSDIVAGIDAVQILSSPGLNLLVDLGTNGEIVLGSRDIAL